MPITKEYWKLQDVCLFLKLSEESVRRLNMHAYRTAGGHRRFAAKDVLKIKKLMDMKEKITAQIWKKEEE